MATYLEHANVTVPDADSAIRFLMLVDPTFVIRHDGISDDGCRWVHIGNEQFYIAIQEPEEGGGKAEAYTTYLNHGINHIGWVVDDFEATIGRLKEAGYREGLIVPPHPFRKRAYYFDDAGLEWEISSYQTDKNEERNSYD